MPDESKHFVYVLESTRSPDCHYSGLTSDVAARLAAHNDARSLHTAKHGPWKLLVSMESTDADSSGQVRALSQDRLRPRNRPTPLLTRHATRPRGECECLVRGRVCGARFVHRVH